MELPDVKSDLIIDTNKDAQNEFLSITENEPKDLSSKVILYYLRVIVKYLIKIIYT